MDKSLFEKWKRNIPRGGVDLIPGCLVCEIHFPEESIERYIKTTAVNGSVVSLKRSKPSLKPDAVPTIFPNLPPHLYRTLKRVAPPGGLPSDPKRSKMSSNDDISDVNKEESESIEYSEIQHEPSSGNTVNDSEVSSSQNAIKEKSLDSHCSTTPESKVTSSTQDYSECSLVQHPMSNFYDLINSHECFHGTIKQKNKFFINSSHPNTAEEGSNDIKHLNNERKRYSPSILSRSVPTNKKTVSQQKSCSLINDQSIPDTTECFQIIIAEGNTDESNNKNEGFSFRYLKDNIEDVKVPSWHWSCSFLRNSIAFLDWGNNFETRKKVIINYDMKYKIFIMNKEVFIKGFEGPKSFQDLQTLLQIVEKITLCQGTEIGEEKQWSKNCFGFVPPREEGMKRILKRKCDECIKELQNVSSAEKRNEEKRRKRVQRLSNAFSTERLKNKGMTLMVQKLRHKVQQLSNELKRKNPTSKLLYQKNMNTFLNEGNNSDYNKKGEIIIEESIVTEEDLFLV